LWGKWVMSGPLRGDFFDSHCSYCLWALVPVRQSGDLSYYYRPTIIIYNCCPLWNTERSTWITLRSLFCQNNSALHTLSTDRGSRRSPSTRPNRRPFPRQRTPSRCRTLRRTGGRLRHSAFCLSRCLFWRIKMFILGSRPWPFRVKWCHRWSRDHWTRDGPFPIGGPGGGPLDPSLYL